MRTLSFHQARKEIQDQAEKINQIAYDMENS